MANLKKKSIGMVSATSCERCFNAACRNSGTLGLFIPGACKDNMPNIPGMRADGSGSASFVKSLLIENESLLLENQQLKTELLTLKKEYGIDD